MNKFEKTIEEQFSIIPIKISEFINDNNVCDCNRRNYGYKNIQLPLAKFHCVTHDRWTKDEKAHNVDCLYGLPKEIFNKIEKENIEDFIEVWNKVLKFIWNEWFDDYSKNRQKLFLMVRSHLTVDYGYFNLIDTNKLFRVINE